MSASFVSFFLLVLLTRLTVSTLVPKELSDGECRSQLQTIQNAVDRNEQWALAMLDAAAKPQMGILMGNIMHVGNYDQCLKIDERVGSMRIQGKYCTALVEQHPVFGGLPDILADVVRANMTGSLAERGLVSYGFCVPKVCTEKELQNWAQYFENETQSPVHFQFMDQLCDGGDGLPFTTSTIIGIVVFSLFGVALVLSTLYDIFRDSREPDLLTSFSVYTNGKKLLSASSAEGNLNCLNGIRVISMMWIILAHGFQYSFYVPRVNAAELMGWREALENSLIVGGSMAVDSFFTVSGLLVVYLFLRSRDKGVKFSLPMFYLHRILRLTPSLVMLIILTLTLLDHMGSGPFWPPVNEIYVQPCEKKWWSTLIYLQNYINPNYQCVGHAWYLAVDTQMYFISPLIFLPLVKWPKRTIGAVIIYVVLSCAYVFEITWKKHLGTTFFNQDADTFIYLFVPTHVRGAVYLMGMIFGYYVYKTKTSAPLKLSKTKVTLLWLFSLSVLVAIVLAHSAMMQPQEYDVLASSLFNALTRVGWAFALSIIILLCVNDYGGLINSFLASKIFTVLIRFNYSVYMLHITILVLKISLERVPVYFSNMMSFHQFWADYALTLAAALVWTLTFESPILVIEKIVFGKKPLKPKRSETDSTSSTRSVEDSIDIQIYENGSTIAQKSLYLEPLEAKKSETDATNSTKSVEDSVDKQICENGKTSAQKANF